MELRICCDQILSRIKQKSKDIESIKDDIKKCFTKLHNERDGKRLSFDFGLRCLTAITTSIPKKKSEWTSDVWSVSEVVSFVLYCYDHILNTDLNDVGVSRCLYFVLMDVLDLDYVEALSVSNRLLANLNRDESSTNSVVPIARNCFAKLWNAALLYEQSRSVALKLRLESLSYLSFSSSEASKFCTKAVHAAHVYFNAVYGCKTNDYGCVDEANEYTVRILNLFRERTMKNVTSSDILVVTEDLIKLVRMTLQLFLNRNRFDFAYSLIEAARKTFESLLKGNRSILTFALDVFESFVGLDSILVVEKFDRGDKTVILLTKCVTFLKNDDEGFMAKEKLLSPLIYFLRVQLRAITEKVFEKLETSLDISQCIRPLSKFVRAIVRHAMKHVSIDDSLQLCYTMLLLQSYVVRALGENCGTLFEIVDDAEKLVNVFASIVTAKQTAEKVLDAIYLFLTSTHTMVNSLYNKKLYVRCLPFVHPYVGLLMKSYGSSKDETKSVQFWKRMNGLVFCLNRAEKFKESLQVIAEFLAKDMGQDEEAIALWVSVKREADLASSSSSEHVAEMKKTISAINTRSLVEPLLLLRKTSFEARRVRSVGLLKLELEAFRAKVFGATEDGLHVIISDLIELANNDPLEMSYALVQMARFLLYRHPDYDRKWNPTKCCREALKQLEKSKMSKNKKTVFVFGSSEDYLVAQAKFILYLSGMQTRYGVLEEKISKQEAKIAELKKKQREDVQKSNPAESEKMDDIDNDEEEMANYDSSTLEEELQVLSELDSCVRMWRSILVANSDDVNPMFVVDVLQDLRCATEIYSTARFYSREVSTWELFLDLAKKSRKWSDYIDGVARYGTTLARLGLTDRAESLLEDASSCMEQQLDPTDPDTLLLSVSMLLAKSELNLMKNSIDKGWEELCLAQRSIKDSRRTKAIMLLNSVALALESKYCELPVTVLRPELSERRETPVEAMASAVRLCSSLLSFCSKDGQTMTMLFKQRLLGCVMDCSFRLGQLHYNLGSIRDARCFFREVSSWSRRFFFVNRNVDIMLLQSRIDLLLDETAMCQVKLNEVQHIMDSTDVTSSSSTTTTTEKNKSPDENVELDDNQDDGFSIRSPVRSDRFLSIPSTTTSSSPCMTSVKRTVSSLNEHDAKCQCARCKHIVVHQLRAESLFVRLELMGMPIESVKDVLKRAKRLSAIEKSLLAKIVGNSCKAPLSQIEISSCWLMSRMAEKQFDDGSVRVALNLVTNALSKLSSFRLEGIGQLHFLEATLGYQKCLAQLLLLARREGKTSISRLYDTMWSTTTSAVVNDNKVEDGVVDCLTAGIANIDIKTSNKTSCDFKTPKQRPPLNRIRKTPHFSNSGNSSSVDSKIKPITGLLKDIASSSNKKRVQFNCAAPKKKRLQMSVFENQFSPPEDSDSDYNKRQNNTIIISDDDDDIVSPIGFDSPGRINSKDSIESPHKKTSSKGVVYRIKPDKENSDNEDFLSSPLMKSLCKRRQPLDSVLDRMINVDFEGSPIRNETPRRREKDSLNVERVRDEDYMECEIMTETSDVVATRRTTRNVTKKLAHDTVGRRTRSKSALHVEEVEINRGGEDESSKGTNKKKKKLAKTQVEVRRSPRHDNFVENEVDMNFTMDSIISTLDKAIRCVEHHPQVPLYEDLNLLLALCTGDRIAGTAGNILESVGVTLRHYTCDRLGSTMRNVTTAATNDGESESVTWNMETRRKFISFSEGSLKINDGNDNDGTFKHVTDKLPKDWVVCQINKLPDILTGNAKNPELFVTRLERGHKPVVVKIDCSNRTLGARDFLSELNDILSEMKLNSRFKNAEVWWRTRRELDARLKSLLQSMEDFCLGPWKCLLLGRPHQETDRKKLQEATKQILRDIVSLKLPFVNEHLLELVIDCWPWLKPEHFDVALSRACGISETDSRLRKICSVVNDRIRNLWSIGMSRKVVVLILDKTVHCFPWESLPILRSFPVSRMPSVHFLLGHLAVHLRSDIVNGPTLDPLKSSFYIVNPSGDLVRTENHLGTLFNNDLKWPGIAGRPPTRDEWTNTLSTKDLFIYCGHGAGSIYAAGEVIEKKVCRATTILMGCSSARLTRQGRNLEAHGIILQYLIAGCPCVIGNLWDVTDKDIDKLTETLIKKWIPEPSDHRNNNKDKCILDCLCLAREATILNYLIGSAPVTYGIPVYSRKATTC